MATQSKQIFVGDLVTLKSGGPRMTVSSYIGPKYVKCSYFTEGPTFTIGNFIEVKVDKRALNKVEDTTEE